MEYFSVLKREQSDDKYCHKDETQKYYAGEGVEKREPSYTIGGNAN